MITTASILQNNLNNAISIYVTHDGGVAQQDINNFTNNIAIFKQHLNFNINLVNVSTHPHFQQINKPNAHWTKEVNYKILAPSLFLNLDRILFLDCDVIIKGNLKDFYNMDMGNNLFVGDAFAFGTKLKNVCAGLMLINLDLARQQNTEDKFVKLYAKAPYPNRRISY